MDQAMWTVPERVAARAAERWTPGPGGCHISTYAVNHKGYAQIAWREDGRHRTAGAHRASWVHTNGPIPVGLTVDHKCKTTNCVNAAHLVLVTHAVNSAQSKTKHSETGGLCRLGHRMIRTPSGREWCRPCEAKRQRERRTDVRGIRVSDALAIMRDQA